jgi:hypothetical protein
MYKKAYVSAFLVFDYVLTMNEAIHLFKVIDAHCVNTDLCSSEESSMNAEVIPKSTNHRQGNVKHSGIIGLVILEGRKI